MYLIHIKQLLHSLCTAAPPLKKIGKKRPSFPIFSRGGAALHRLLLQRWREVPSSIVVFIDYFIFFFILNSYIQSLHSHTICSCSQVFQGACYIPVVLPGKYQDLLNPFFRQTWTVLLSTHVTALTTHGGLRFMQVPLLSTERALKTHGRKNKEDCTVWTSHAVYARTSTEYWKSFNNLRWQEQRKLPRVNLTRGRWNVTYKTLYKEIDWLYKEIIL